MTSRGEIDWADPGEAGRRLVTVFSRAGPCRGRLAVAVVCTSARLDWRKQPPHGLPFHAGALAFPLDDVAQCENVMSIVWTTLDLANSPIGLCDVIALRDMGRAIGLVIESDSEPIGRTAYA